MYYSSTINIVKSRRVRWVGLIVRMKAMRKTYKLSVGKPGRKR
jgi:hypothetical protein